MATLDEIFASMPDEAAEGTHELLKIDAEARQIYVPEAELILGVENDGKAETKYFSCPRYVGKGVDLAACFLRVNYRNANGEVDAYLVNDLTTDGDMVYFSWELSKKVTLYKGVVQFLVCACSAVDSTVEWHTTLASGTSLEGLEPDAAAAEAATADVIAQLLALVTSQTAAVEAAGAEQVQTVQGEGAAQVQAVQTAAANAEAAALAEIEAKGANTLDSIPEDYAALSAQVDRNTRSHAGAIVCAAEGTAIQVNDASDNYLAGLRLFGKSTQDGTPTPEAPVEIVSLPAPVVRVCGKNLLQNNLPTATNCGITYTQNADGSITLNGTATDISYYTFDFYNPVPVRNEKLILSISGGGGLTSITAGYFDADGKVTNAVAYAENSEMEMVYPDEAVLTRTFLTVTAGKVCNNVVVYPMLRLASIEDSTHEPYKVAQVLTLANGLPGIPVASGGNYTDENGQEWICDEVDLARGVYVQRIGNATYNGDSGEYIATYGLTGTAFGISRKSDDYQPPATSDTIQPALCDKLTATSTGDIYSNGKNATFAFSVSGNVIRFSLDALHGFTPDEVRVWLADNPLTFVYILANPVETPLTEVELAAWAALHSNKPTTTILNDAGAHMAAEYVADTKLYIDGKLAEIAAGLTT